MAFATRGNYIRKSDLRNAVKRISVIKDSTFFAAALCFKTDVSTDEKFIQVGVPGITFD